MRWLVVTLWLVSCARAASTDPGPRPEMELQNVTVKHQRGAVTELIATAPKLELWGGGTEFVAPDASVHVLAHGADLVARELRGTPADGIADGWGVVFSIDGGTTGSTPRARYQKDAHAVYGGEGISLATPGLALDAGGYSIDLQTQRAEFTQPVSRVTSSP